MNRQSYLKNQKPLKIGAGQKWRHKAQTMTCIVEKVDKETVFWKYDYASAKDDHDFPYPLVSFLEDFEWIDSDENHE